MPKHSFWITLSLMVVIAISLSVNQTILGSTRSETIVDDNTSDIVIVGLDNDDAEIKLALRTLRVELKNGDLPFSTKLLRNPEDLEGLFRWWSEKTVVLVGHGTPEGLQGEETSLAWPSVGRLLSRSPHARMIFLACYSAKAFVEPDEVKTISFEGLVDAKGGALLSAALIESYFKQNFNSDRLATAMEFQQEMRNPLAETIWVNGEDTWLFGINYPWRIDYYGRDWSEGTFEKFTSDAETDFRIMHNMGIHVVRWWLEIELKGDGDFFRLDATGRPVGYHDTAIQRLRWVLWELCPKYDIYLIPTIFSHNFVPSNKLSDSSWRDDLINLAAGLAVKFPSRGNSVNGSTHLLAWDLWNEPSLVGNVPHRDMRIVLSLLASEFNARDPNCRLTIGDRKPIVEQIHDDLSQGNPTYWDIGYLDFFSMHHYRDDGYLPTYSGSDLDIGIPMLIGECGADTNSEPIQMDAIAKFAKNAYERGYLGVLPWNFEEDVEWNDKWPFIYDIKTARNTPDTEDTLGNPLNWRERSHPFMAFEDDHWDEVSIAPTNTFRTDFSQTDWTYAQGPRVWSIVSNGWEDNNDNMIRSGASGYSLFVNVPNYLSGYDVSLKLVFSTYQTNIWIKQRLTSGYESRAQYNSWTYDNRWVVVLDLNHDYYDAGGIQYGGRNVEIRLESKSGMPFTLKLYGGQVTVYPSEENEGWDGFISDGALAPNSNWYWGINQVYQAFGVKRFDMGFGADSDHAYLYMRGDANPYSDYYGFYNDYVATNMGGQEITVRIDLHAYVEASSKISSVENWRVWVVDDVEGRITMTDVLAQANYFDDPIRTWFQRIVSLTFFCPQDDSFRILIYVGDGWSADWSQGLRVDIHSVTFPTC